MHFLFSPRVLHVYHLVLPDLIIILVALVTTQGKIYKAHL